MKMKKEKENENENENEDDVARSPHVDHCARFTKKEGKDQKWKSNWNGKWKGC